MNLFICQTIAIGCGYILDLLIGDPHWLYHPVSLIGNLISLLESILLKEKDTSAKKYRKGYGACNINAVNNGYCYCIYSCCWLSY